MLSLALAYGLGVGALLGLTGAGGGILALPALVLGLGMAPQQAMPIALAAVGLAAAVGAAQGFRRGLVRWRAGLLMAACGLCLSPVGSAIGAAVSPPLLLSAFALLMAYTATKLLRQTWPQLRGATGASATACVAETPAPPHCTRSTSTGRFIWTPRCTLTLGAVGSTCGLFSGMMGVGGGFVIVPAFRQWTDVQVHGIVATSLFVVALVSLGSAARLGQGTASWPPEATAFVTAALCGMALSRALAPKLSAQWVQTGFALLTLLVSAALLLSAWRP